MIFIAAGVFVRPEALRQRTLATLSVSGSDGSISPPSAPPWNRKSSHHWRRVSGLQATPSHAHCQSSQAPPPVSRGWKSPTGRPLASGRGQANLSTSAQEVACFQNKATLAALSRPRTRTHRVGFPVRTADVGQEAEVAPPLPTCTPTDGTSNTSSPNWAELLTCTGAEAGRVHVVLADGAAHVHGGVPLQQQLIGGRRGWGEVCG